ncbi:MAG TPA: P-II family nitrogen regulator [Acidimicrobiales bacterium]|nr:P-II family nitrogen regulator [Acidimicrobiales bacterium]
MAYLVTAIIKPYRLEEVREAIRTAGIIGLTVSEVQGYGRQGGKTETFRGSEYTIDFVPKVRVEVLVKDDELDKIIDVIAEAGRTGKIGDGKLWAYSLDRVMRIRTGETSDDAL